MRRRASECWLAVVLLVSGILHGEGVAARGVGFIAARPAEGSVVARGAARPGAWGCRRGAWNGCAAACTAPPRHGLRAGTVSTRRPRGARSPRPRPLTGGRRGPAAEGAAASRSGGAERARATWRCGNPAGSRPLGARSPRWGLGRRGPPAQPGASDADATRKAGWLCASGPAGHSLSAASRRGRRYLAIFLGFIPASRRQSGIRGRGDYLGQAEQRPHAPQNNAGMG